MGRGKNQNGGPKMQLRKQLMIKKSFQLCILLLGLVGLIQCASEPTHSELESLVDNQVLATDKEGSAQTAPVFTDETDSITTFAGFGVTKIEPIVFNSGTINQTIPDNNRGQLNASFKIKESQIVGIGLELSITHKIPTELVVNLVNPEGDKFLICNRNCSLAEGRTGTIKLGINGHQPAGFMEFVGKKAAGNWKIAITDDVNGDVGQLNSFQITTYPDPGNFLYIPHFSIEQEDIKQVIPDNNPVGLHYSFLVDRAAHLEEMDLEVKISHSRPGEVSLHLISPQNVSIPICGNQKEVPSCHTLKKSTKFSSYSGSQIDQFSKIKGAPISGVWKLRLTDSSGKDVGTLDSINVNLFDTDGVKDLRPSEETQSFTNLDLVIPDGSPQGAKYIFMPSQIENFSKVIVRTRVIHSRHDEITIKLVNSQGSAITLCDTSEQNRCRFSNNVATFQVSSRQADLRVLLEDSKWALLLIDSVNRDGGHLESFSISFQ